ncbi:Chaperedoxin [Vibrio stylophorae]|uniref:Chaperedoxin n=1 Tax=Vibrio stylophorae TaxID=659351 RepID=A0ABM8ZVU7_9VIBR|nr:co-chaperone YbbN [Vibrio stylophorae]CAH0534146.1 Chaperedoxin [Vibrio stylophorae]
MSTEFIIDLNEQNAQATLQQSMEKPVLVYFWAEMMPESCELLPVMQQIAQQYQGAFTLATLNCEQQQMLAAQFGVQTLPTMALFHHGKPVDGLAGPQPLDAIHAMLEKHLPSQAELDFEKAQQHLAQSEFSQAQALLKPLQQQQPEQGLYALLLAQCNIELGEFDSAEALLATVMMKDQDSLYHSLMAKIDLHKQAADSPEIRALEKEYQQQPNNLQVAQQLALQYSQVQRHDEALAILFAILKTDLNAQDGEIKKTFMEMLSALGQGNASAAQYRRQLYSLLY